MWAWTYWLNSAKLYEASTMRQLQSSLPWPAHKLSTGPGFQTYWHFGPYTSQWQGAVLFSSILGLCSLDAHSIPSSYNNKIYLQILIHVPWGAESSLAEKHWCLHFDLLFSRGLGVSNEIFFFFFLQQGRGIIKFVTVYLLNAYNGSVTLCIVSFIPSCEEDNVPFILQIRHLNTESLSNLPYEA